MINLHNPLINNFDLPKFDEIKNEHILPAVDKVVEEVNLELDLLEQSAKPTWSELILPIAKIEEKLHHTWSPIDHLNSVSNTDELRVFYKQAKHKVVNFSLRLSQSHSIFKALKEIKSGKEWEKLDQTQRRIIDTKILSAENSGVGLSGDLQEEFNNIINELSRLATDFSNHVLDATKAYNLVLENKKDTEGFPDSLLEITSFRFNEYFTDKPTSTRENGPWLIALDYPVFFPFMEYCKNQDLRETVYKTYIQRASEGKLSNQEIICSILIKRKRLANILNYKTYADLSLSEKMVSSVSKVFSFLNDLRVASWDRAKDEYKELCDFAKKNNVNETLKHWDIAFWSKKLQEHKLSYTDDELRPFFPLDGVLNGLFSLTNKLFGVSVEKVTGEAPIWHNDVSFYKVFDKNQKHIASFYLDPYSRSYNKRGGAWMNDCISKSKREGKVINPVAYLVCNFTPPTDKTPSLLTFQEVTTLFHEFGHGLQHMLTKITYLDASGIRGIEWDAVELPSQFMENWCYNPSTIKQIAIHYKTKQKIPTHYIDKLIESRKFRAATQMLRQIQFSLIDMTLHYDYDVKGELSPFEVHKNIAKTTSVLDVLDEDKFLCSFSHIFAGGYAAGYYSYKWAEIMSADAFSAFEEAGIENEEKLKELGERFRNTILALGGSCKPDIIYKNFRGRDPKVDALLKQSGLC